MNNIEETINAQLAKLYSELAAWELIEKGHKELERIDGVMYEHYCVHSNEARHCIQQLSTRIEQLIDANNVLHREMIKATLYKEMNKEIRNETQTNATE